MKKIFILILIMILNTKISTTISANASIDFISLRIGLPLSYRNGVIVIDNTNKNIKPYILNNRTMVPLRFMSEQLGFNIFWNDEEKAVTLEKYNNGK